MVTGLEVDFYHNVQSIARTLKNMDKTLQNIYEAIEAIAMEGMAVTKK